MQIQTQVYSSKLLYLAQYMPLTWWGTSVKGVPVVKLILFRLGKVCLNIQYEGY